MENNNTGKATGAKQPSSARHAFDRAGHLGVESQANAGYSGEGGVPLGTFHHSQPAALEHLRQADAQLGDGQHVQITSRRSSECAATYNNASPPLPIVHPQPPSPVPPLCMPTRPPFGENPASFYGGAVSTARGVGGDLVVFTPPPHAGLYARDHYGQLVPVVARTMADTENGLVLAGSSSTNRLVHLRENKLALRKALKRRLRELEKEDSRLDCEEDLKFRIKSRKELAAVLPPGSHVPDFGVVPLLSLPFCCARKSKSDDAPVGESFDARDPARTNSGDDRRRAVVSFALRLSLGIVCFALAIVVALDMGTTLRGLATSEKRLTKECGTATLL